MKTIQQYTDLIHERITALPLDKEPAGLYAPIRYALDAGGKRLRPVLALAVAEAIAGDCEVAVNQALAVEMFHNFTLLHDDVMDKADVRRGRPTVHKQFDENTAILSGDTMLTLASQLAMEGCDTSTLRPVLNMLNTTAVEVYEGQQLDMDFERRADVSVDEYMEMIRLKTSVLLGCSCALGAIMAGALPQVVRAMYSYGEKLGISFQLKDDWLDTYGDPSTFGKAIGGDIVNEKKTWLLINAMNEDKEGVIAGVLGKNIDAQEKIEIVRGVYNRLGLSERCRSLEVCYAEEAVKSLADAQLSAVPYRFFEELALNSVKRNK
ncbi:MAG: polyprenyl synthetase family protein [Muribaculaceae bacterium]|nr:polyprenyl synthetase family protein [Muribaculaceae bacterium]